MAGGLPGMNDKAGGASDGADARSAARFAALEAQAHLPTSPEALLARLEALGIETRTVEHAPVFTVEESQALRGGLEGGHIKNLFLRNKREEMWLVTIEESKRIDLKALGERLGAGKLSFGSAERLMKYLGVIPGSVTPFAVINDKDKAVTMVLDRQLLSKNPLHAHPLVNFKSTAIAAQDLVRFLEAEDHAPLLMDFA
jgi:Ala-tRNA(Pro) deacylase